MLVLCIFLNELLFNQINTINTTFYQRSTFCFHVYRQNKIKMPCLVCCVLSFNLMDFGCEREYTVHNTQTMLVLVGRGRMGKWKPRSKGSYKRLWSENPFPHLNCFFTFPKNFFLCFFEAHYFSKSSNISTNMLLHLISRSTNCQEIKQCL